MEPLLESLRTGTDTDELHTEEAHKTATEQLATLDRAKLEEVQRGLDAALLRARTDNTVRTRIELLKVRVQLQLANSNNPSFGTAISTVGSTLGGAIGTTARGADTVLRSGSEAMASGPIARYGILAGLVGSAYMVPRFFRKLFTGRWSTETPEEIQKREKDESERKAKVLAAGGTYTAPRNGPSTGRSIFATLSTVALSVGAFVGLNAIGRNNNNNTPGSGPAA